MTDTDHDAPTVVRRLSTPEATELANLASVFEDLQLVLKCCEELISRLARAAERSASGTSIGTDEDVVAQALWQSALVAYARCFSRGEKRAALTEKDLAETGLQGEVVQWHTMLLRARDHLTSSQAQPRDGCVIGAALDADGRATGIAIVSSPLPPVDELSVRQTGRLALELSTLVDSRMGAAQRAVFESARGMSPRLLASLPEVHLAAGPA